MQNTQMFAIALYYKLSHMKAPGSDLSEIVHVVFALDISFYVWRKILKAGGRGLVSKNRATVVHMLGPE